MRGPLFSDEEKWEMEDKPPGGGGHAPPGKVEKAHRSRPGQVGRAQRGWCSEMPSLWEGCSPLR